MKEHDQAPRFTWAKHMTAPYYTRKWTSNYAKKNKLDETVGAT